MERDLFAELFLKVVEKNYSNTNFSFTTVLSEFEMSRSTFSRNVQKEFNSTPQVFLRDYRLQKAFDLLANKQGGILDIAENSGFHNLSYFNRSFKSKYGKTPTRLAKINK